MSDATYGGAYEKEQVELRGRHRIYTDVREITESNVISVLQDALMIHEKNRQEMIYLLNYEKGHQPLKREKKIRADINIEVADNIANQITEFWLGYFWGNQWTYVQRGDRNLSIDGSGSDESAITLLNQMNDNEQSYTKVQELARYVEICGLGYQMVDIKRNYVKGGSVFDLHTLDPMNSFVVYRNDIWNTPMMGVAYTQLKNGDRYFTCVTKDRWFEIRNITELIDGAKMQTWGHFGKSGMMNPIGKVPFVEYVRSADRMGVWERQISEMDALNIEVSDYANAVAQATQEIWWMNDADFPADPVTGAAIKPTSGQWMKTKTAPNGNRPMIQALSSTFNYNGVQENIMNKRDIILQKCYVPLQSEPGGGSTGTAYSMSSGWTATEAVATKQESIIRGAVMDLVELELLAIKNSGYLPSGHALEKLQITDIYPKFPRQKTFDLGTKTNAMVTMIKAGIHGRTAMQVVDLFPDVTQAWADSKDLIEKFQTSLFERNQNRESAEAGSKRTMSDLTDQEVNSPTLDGFRTGRDKGGDV